MLPMDLRALILAEGKADMPVSRQMRSKTLCSALVMLFANRLLQQK